jgi:hypothetical protein
MRSRTSALKIALPAPHLIPENRRELIMRLNRPIVRLLAAVAAVALPIGLGRSQRTVACAQQVTEHAKAWAVTQGADWTATVEPNAAVRIYHKGSLVVDMTNVYWGPKWQWGGATFNRAPGTGEQYGLVGEVPILKLKARGRISVPSPNTIEIVYQFTASADIPEAVGGGLVWHFRLDAPSFEGRLPDPELLADQTGWTWKTSPDQAITLRFDKPVAKVYFDRNQKNEVRTFLFADHVPAGSHLFRATLELPMGASHALAADERYGSPDTSQWFKNALAGDTSPVDLSFLNRDDRPAGRHGLVKADGDHLVFEDGTPGRFWGANLAAYALFSTPRQNVARQAHRMAQLGYNLMRIVHIDAPWVNPNIFADHGRRDTRHLDPKSLDSLDWWIKCLKDEGIYVWLDMVYTRTLTENDGVTIGFDEIKRRQGQVLGFSYFNPDVARLMREFQHQYLGHVNRYTGLAYKDDPAVMAVLITNENDLTQHDGNLMLPDKKNPVHNALFTRGYKSFAREHGLAEGRVWQTWLPGPSKLYLNDVEHQFNRAMIKDLRDLGVKSPIATTHFWGNESLYSLPSLTDGDVIDVHSYGTSEAMSANPRYDPNYLSWIAAAHVDGKPLTITEWNVPYPEGDRFTSPLYLASVAALQGWDAPMLYNYSQSALSAPGKPEVWSSFFDPALTGVMPAAALAYRQQHVSPARTSYCLMLTSEQLFDRALDPRTSAAIRTLTEQSKLTIGMPQVKELPWLAPTKPSAQVTTITDPDHDFIPTDQTFVRSDTGELLRNWKYGIQLIDTPKTQAVSGWIEGKTLKTKDVTFLFNNKKAVVALTSLDSQPLNTSRFILITAMARVVASSGNRLPLLSEPVNGTIRLRTTTADLELLSLGSDAHTVHRSVPVRDKDALAIQIPAPRGTHWYLLKRGEPK